MQLALANLDRGGSVAEAAAALLDGTRDWWAEHAEEEEVLTNLDAIRLQAAGQAFHGDRLDLVGKYEVHLHRSLVRVLAMLSSLQERRKTVRAEVISFGKNEAA